MDWPESQGYKLGAVDDSDPFAGTRHYLNPGETVATDATRTFWFQMTAPRTTGTYTTDWRMVREGVHWFGHSLVKQVVVNPPQASLGFLGASPALTISGAVGLTQPMSTRTFEPVADDELCPIFLIAPTS